MSNILGKLIRHPATAISGAVLAAGGTGLGGGLVGYKVGQKRGADRTATAMASAFSEGNEIENQRLARYFFQKGLQYNPKLKKESSMDKQAYLQEIYNEAFSDELEKIARMPGGRTASKIFKYLGQALTPKATHQFGLSRGAYVRDAIDAAIVGAKGLGSNAIVGAKNLGNSAKGLGSNAIVGAKGVAGLSLSDAVRKGALVLGTAGAVGSAGVAGAAIAGRRKNDKEMR